MNDLECLGNASEFMTIESNTSPSFSPSFDDALKNFEFEYSTNSLSIKHAADETCEIYNPGWVELDNTSAVPSVASQISRDFWNLQPDSIIPNQSSQSMWGISGDDLSDDQFYGAIFNSSNTNIVDHFEEFSEFSPPGNILNVELLVNPSIIGDECLNFDEQFLRTIMEPSTASNQGYLSRGGVHSIAEEIVKFSILESRPQTCPTAESDEQSKQPPTKERPTTIPSSRVENPLKSGKAPLKKMDQCKERKLPLRNGKVREQMLEELREKMEKLPAKRTATRRNAETTKIKMDGPEVDGEKKEWNKIAATRYRDRRRLTVLESEVLCGKLEKRNAFLKQQIESMELEKETIRNFMLDIWRK